MRKIESSEMILNEDGTIFHLHLLPEQLADTIILVGDPGRVDLVASLFDEVECSVANRELKTVTGTYKGKRMSVVATGMGVGCVDIVVNELDALANVDFATREVKSERKVLTMLRIGTSGAIQPDIEIGDYVFGRTSVGFDGLLSFYKGRNEVCDLELERAFLEQSAPWDVNMPRPYFIDADESLYAHFKDSVVEGITATASGFFAPQGRWVTLEPADLKLNEKIEAFEYEGRRITNFEMESSVLAGLGALMGHRAGTVCCIIAQRLAKESNTDYKALIKGLIVMSLDKLATFE